MVDELDWCGACYLARANDRELEVLGYTAEEYIGQPIMKFCPDSEKDVLEIFKQLGSGNTIRDVPVRFRTKSGEIRDLLIDSNVSYNTDGSFKHTRCFIRDDSARKVREARSETARRFLEQQAEDKEEFTRLLFHEILTPCHISLQSLQRFELASTGGIGLGLNVAYNLVQGMGGTLHVESDASTGTCFSFSLSMPLCPDTSLAEAHKSDTDDVTSEQSWPHVMESEAAKRIVDDPPGLTSEPLSGKNKSSRVGLKNASHVLVVDDNTICQKVLCRTLANLNCSTEVASNGQQATDKLAAHDVSIYSAVMMDLRMPVMDGLSATRVIRNDLGIKHVPIVAISAERSDELYKDCLNAGMDDFIQKPASKVSIQETLQKLGVLDRDENDENDSP